jgi:predicted nucleotidyltransferase
MTWGRTFDPKDAARDAVEAARQAVREQLVSAVLYGSAAGGEFDPRASDVNVAFVFTALGPPELSALRPAHSLWVRRRVVHPLLLTREGLTHSADAFPLEYLLIRERHETLHGPDLFAAITIDAPVLRTAVERVLRTQALGLTTTYLALAGSASGARHWARRASTAIAASTSGLLHLTGEPIPRTRRELVERAGARFGIDAPALSLLLAPESREPLEVGALLASAQILLERLIDAAERLDGPPAKP